MAKFPRGAGKIIAELSPRHDCRFRRLLSTLGQYRHILRFSEAEANVKGRRRRRGVVLPGAEAMPCRDRLREQVPSLANFTNSFWAPCKTPHDKNHRANEHEKTWSDALQGAQKEELVKFASSAKVEARAAPLAAIVGNDA